MNFGKIEYLTINIMYQTKNYYQNVLRQLIKQNLQFGVS